MGRPRNRKEYEQKMKQDLPLFKKLVGPCPPELEKAMAGGYVEQGSSVTTLQPDGTVLVITPICSRAGQVIAHVHIRSTKGMDLISAELRPKRAAK